MPTALSQTNNQKLVRAVYIAQLIITKNEVRDMAAMQNDVKHPIPFYYHSQVCTLGTLHIKCTSIAWVKSAFRWFTQP
jgi:hypothetical protein